MSWRAPRGRSTATPLAARGRCKGGLRRMEGKIDSYFCIRATLQTQLRNFTSAQGYFSEIPYLYLGRLRQAPETAACSPIYIDVGACGWFARPAGKGDDPGNEF